MNSKKQKIAILFAAAEAARTTELRQALRDPWCWAEQLVLVLVMAMKCVTLAVLVASAGRIAGADEQLALAFGFVIILGVLPFNPRRFFWRVPFVERADRAFDEYLRLARDAERL